jgi:hypothetical protein
MRGPTLPNAIADALANSDSDNIIQTERKREKKTEK